MNRELAVAWNRVRVARGVTRPGPVRVTWQEPKPWKGKRRKVVPREMLRREPYSERYVRSRQKWTGKGVSPKVAEELEVLAGRLGHPVPRPRSREVAEALLLEWRRQAAEKYVVRAARDRPAQREGMKAVMGVPTRRGLLRATSRQMGELRALTGRDQPVMNRDQAEQLLKVYRRSSPPRA